MDQPLDSVLKMVDGQGTRYSLFPDDIRMPGSYGLGPQGGGVVHRLLKLHQGCVNLEKNTSISMVPSGAQG